MSGLFRETMQRMTLLSQHQSLVHTKSHAHWWGLTLRSLLIFGIFLSALVTFTQTAHAAVATLSRSVTIDNVTVTLQSNFISMGQFVPSTQELSAMISQYHPYQSFSIQAIPYGRGAPNEISTAVSAGSASTVTALLQKGRAG